MPEILPTIDSPQELKQLPPTSLPLLAKEIREFIISTVSKSGGHLASSLGVVELAIALHYCYETPKDKIIWDVGHQCYAHKLLTGRRERFDTLREYKGVSGFPKTTESPYDSFNTGHSSTSISAALGMAVARDLAGEHHKIVCVIGDGALTGGMAFEALNNAGALKKDLCVILNDNAMSISKNVGAMAAYLNKIITGQLYNKMKGELEYLLRSIPQIGDPIFKLATKVDEAVKSLFVPGVMFEELGFKYVGPIDGHSINNLIETLRAIRRFNKPVLLHVITQKGKGYIHAEENAASFHSAAPFSIESGRFRKPEGKTTFTKIFSETICQIAESDKRVCTVTAAMREGTGLECFSRMFPDRFFDVGIAEQHAVTFAAGMAIKGLRPVVAIYSTFLQRAYDQILHDVCLQNLPVCFVLDRAGIVGPDGPTHNGLFDLSYLRQLPNIVVMSPNDGIELQRMLATALSLDQPVAIRYPKTYIDPIDKDTKTSEMERLPIGRAELLLEGNDLMILSIGTMSTSALEAVKLLSAENIDVTLVNARFVKPMDEALISSLAVRIKRLITIEENALAGGFGSAVLEMLDEKGLLSGIRTQRLGIPDTFVPAGPRDKMLELYHLTPDEIAKACKRLLD